MFAPFLEETAMGPEIALGGVMMFLLCIYVLRLKHHHQKYANIPMATPRIPFVGNAWNLDMSRCHIVLAGWAQKFGPVFRIKVFNEEILVLNNFESIYDALVLKGSTFAGRPPMYRTSKSGRNKHSIVWQTYTEKLQYLRKETLKSVRMYGDGRDNLEYKCRPEILKMLESIRRWNGVNFDPLDDLYTAVANVMLGLTLDTSFDPSSQSSQTIKDINRLFNDTFGTGNGRHMDFLLSRIGNYKYSQRLKAALRLRDEFWDSELQLLKKRTVSDCIVQRFLSLTSDPKGKQMAVEETTAKEVFTNLILAGTDTTATTLTCLLLVFLHHPTIQEKMWAELHDHVGESRLATLSDRTHMPYVQAVLLELLRYTSHVPLAVPHYTMCDTSVMGIPVPKNMTVYINLWSLHHDPDDWVEPWTFRPERFLDASDQLITASHPIRRKLMTFGAGRRVCLGEALAKNRLFLFTAALVQHFRFVPSTEDITVPEVDPRTYEMGLVIHPKRFKLQAIPRR